ncbi:hypothetical protein [Ralstonia phage RP13]|nr:hypothetical protein [Ralstonia phage RP13]
MNIFILYQSADHGQIPDTIQLVQSFGNESIHIDSISPVATGQVVLLEGASNEFKKWLGGKEIWTTNNPMCGTWNKKKVEKIDMTLVPIDTANPDFFEWGRNCQKMGLSDSYSVNMLETQWSIDVRTDVRMDDFWTGFQSDLSISLPKIGDEVEGMKVTRVMKLTTYLYDIFGMPSQFNKGASKSARENGIKIGTFSRVTGFGA